MKRIDKKVCIALDITSSFGGGRSRDALVRFCSGRTQKGSRWMEAGRNMKGGRRERKETGQWAVGGYLFVSHGQGTVGTVGTVVR